MAVVSKLGYRLCSTEKVGNFPQTRPDLKPAKSNYQGMGPRYQTALKALQVIPMCSKGGESLFIEHLVISFSLRALPEESISK